MLKKLRLKFILINMTIVTIMLGMIFCLLYFSTGRNLERESMQMMKIIGQFHHIIIYKVCTFLGKNAVG